MMETSDNFEAKIYRVNNNLCGFSPSGNYFAIAHRSNLIIKTTDNLETRNTYEFNDTIEYIEWSPDSQYILCASIKRAIVRIYSVDYPEWGWKLEEGSAGIEQTTWSPDSTHIISIADSNIQVGVWSLEGRRVACIQNLKSLTKRNVEFSPDGQYLATITTDEGVDSVEIYKTEEWKISRFFSSTKINDHHTPTPQDFQYHVDFNNFFNFLKGR